MHNQYLPLGTSLAGGQSSLGLCDQKGNLLVSFSALSSGAITASGLIKTGPGRVMKVFVSASTAGTLTLWDNTAASGTKILDAFPLTAGQVIALDGVSFANGLFATIGGTSATITVTYN